MPARRLAALAVFVAATACAAAPPERAPSPDARPNIPNVEFVSPRGPVCSDARVLGRELPEIEGPGRCGIPQPVEVVEVANVALSRPIRINCRTARALATWVERGPARSAPRLLDARLTEIVPSASYACRTRNHRVGGRLSEHAVGNAVDIPAFRLSDGRTISLAEDWDKGDAGKFLRAAWRAACGPFGTVLGPEADAMHRDHFHFDTASYRTGPFCQ